jgi:hypothetical protein
LVAEVQARTGLAFVATDANSYEERMTQQNAQLRMLLASARRDRESADRFLKALASSDPALGPEDWALEAAKIWCAEPEVSAASVVWVEPPTSLAMVKQPNDASAPASRETPLSTSPDQRPPALVVPLKGRGRVRALVQLWSDHGPSELQKRL